MANPLLSSYPHLYNLLRNDPKANAEFNAVVISIRSPAGAADREKELRDSLDAERTLRAEMQSKAEKSSHVTIRTIRFIKLLGEVIEPQVDLKPYEQDVSTKRTYEIRFGAGQIRMALKLYWDVISDHLEAALTSSTAKDPVGDNEDS